jgi:hypothetical protein
LVLLFAPLEDEEDDGELDEEPNDELLLFCVAALLGAPEVELLEADDEGELELL